jgi:hypothetical protein
MLTLNVNVNAEIQAEIHVHRKLLLRNMNIAKYIAQHVATQLAAEDQPRDQPGKCLYCARAFWLYLQSHCRLRKITREIIQASTSTTRGHFGCIFTAIADCAT